MAALRTRVAALGPEDGDSPRVRGADRALGDAVLRVVALNRLLLRYDTAAHREQLVDDLLWLRGVRQRVVAAPPRRSDGRRAG
jgi:hypothetical protein